MPATETAPAPEAPAAKQAGAGGKTVVETAELEYPALLHTVVVRDAAAALAWYEKALGGRVAFRYDDADGRVMHAIISTDWGLMLGVEDHYPKMHMVRPVPEGGADAAGAAAVGCSYVYITIPKGKGSADEMIERMREAGATVAMEPEDKFYGQRMGQVVDEFGVAWVFAHKIEKKGGEAAPEPEPEPEKNGEN